MSIYKNYVYQQHLEYLDEVYVLYFNLAGYDDTSWQILKWKKEDWDRSDKISVQYLEDCKLQEKSNAPDISCKFTSIAFNYDEGPKNLEYPHIFIKNKFLVFERGGLYHTLYDLKTHRLLYNEESPLHASNANDKKEMNIWIKKNLHDKIKAKLGE